MTLPFYCTFALAHICGVGCRSFTGDDMKLQQGERLLKQQANAVWVRGRFNNVVGTLALTTHRLAFEQRSVIQSAILSQFGAAGDLADAAIPRNLGVNLPLAQVASFSRPRVVSSRKVLPITTKNGEEFLFSGPKYEQWAPALMQVGMIEAERAMTPGAIPPSPSQFASPFGSGQQTPYSQQQAYYAGYGHPAGYALPQPQTPSKKGIPWWGWLLIAGGVLLLVCGVLSVLSVVIVALAS
ncbi:MAG TPA: hypothetical protein VFW76_08680 [Ktedonobacterales bacterium]|nr:hypothetical protein [Ktedonobacterales bacterium]